MKIAIGNDQHGFDYKKIIIQLFPEHKFIDVGSYDTTSINYPIVGERVGELVSSGECERGILICGTGIGMAVTANKMKGCYAAVCHDTYSTERSILSNNCNILCMGALVIGKKTMESLTRLWLSLKFDPSSSSTTRVKLIVELEERQSAGV